MCLHSTMLTSKKFWCKFLAEQDLAPTIDTVGARSALALAWRFFALPRFWHGASSLRERNAKAEARNRLHCLAFCSALAWHGASWHCARGAKKKRHAKRRAMALRSKKKRVLCICWHGALLLAPLPWRSQASQSARFFFF